MADDRAELDRMAAEVVAAVEALLRSGKSGRIEVNVNPHTRRRHGQVRTYVQMPDHSVESDATT